MNCPVCGTVLANPHSFCPNCGNRLYTLPPGVGAPNHGHTGAAIGLLLLLGLGALFAAGELGPLVTQVYDGTKGLLTSVACLYPPLCPGSGFKTTPGKASYDQQTSFTFSQSFSSLSYNITAVPQSDSSGFGPAYLLNGKSDSGYWYQIGIAYNWPLSSGTAYDSGFHFIWEVFDPSGATNNPSLSSIPDNIQTNDTVNVSLSFSGGNVILAAHDYNTLASATHSYTAGGGSKFVGSSAVSSSNTPTSLMTEWYHPDPNWTTMKQVTYSESSVAVFSGWACISEYVPPNPSSGVYSSCSSQIILGNSAQAFSYRGINTYSAQNSFQTGPSP